MCETYLKIERDTLAQIIRVSILLHLIGLLVVCSTLLNTESLSLNFAYIWLVPTVLMSLTLSYIGELGGIWAH